MTTQIAEYTRTDAALQDLRKEYKDAEYAVETTAGMKLACAARAELRGYRVNLEKTRVSVKAEALGRCRMVDTEANRIKAALVALEDPIDAQIKAEEGRKEAEREAKIEAERERVAAIQSRIAAIRNLPLAYSGGTAARLAEGIKSLQEIETGDDFAEFVETAKVARSETITKLSDLHALAVAHEAEIARIAADRAELNRLRADQDAAQAKARSEHEAIERKAAAERAEADRVAQVERDRLAAIERGKAQAEAAAIREKAVAEAAAQREQEDRERAERQKVEAEARAKAESAQKVEAERLQGIRDRLAREQAEAMEREIAGATLIEAATQAHDLLCDLGESNHLTTLKLAAALTREAKPKRKTA